jgi:hypothetical protein
VTSLAAYVLSLALASFSPGKTVHSLEPLPACGSDSTEPSCELSPVCKEPSVLCKPPRWDEKLGVWVRFESREAGARRLTVVAQALADAAMFAGAGWSEGPTDLARAMLAASGWSTGLREDIQTGRTRGPAGELCLMDIQPDILRTAVPLDLARLSDDELAAKVLGLEYPELRRCFDAGAVLLVRAKRWSGVHCRDWPGDYALFAAYGTGISCHTMDRHGDYARLRARSYRKFRAMRDTIFPSWYRKEPGNKPDGERVATADPPS